MTSNWLASQLLLFAVGSLFVLFLRWRYRATISRVARRQAYQYALYAIRDQAIRLVVDGTVNETDGDWQKLYGFLNESAKAVTVDTATNSRFGPLFFFHLVRSLPKPPSGLSREMQAAPEPIKNLWCKEAHALVAIIFDGNMTFRWCLNTVVKLGKVHQFVTRTFPDICEKYLALENLANKNSYPPQAATT